MRVKNTDSARDRLLMAAAKLLHESGGDPVSTRAICELAGVQAPTLYHHFGDKQGLLDAVVSHGFRQFLSERRAQAGSDPVAMIREAWDNHVQFGLEHPAFFASIYGQIQPGKPCSVIAGMEEGLLEALRPAARQGRLLVSPAEAAAEVLAGSIGVTLSLITQPPEEVDLALSERLREAVLASITTSQPATAAGPGFEESIAAIAISLGAALEGQPTDLTEGESVLLREWLYRLGSHRPRPTAATRP